MAEKALHSLAAAQLEAVEKTAVRSEMAALNRAAGERTEASASRRR